MCHSRMEIKKTSYDSSALVGLRGLVSLHVMVFHYFPFANLDSLHGDMQMTLFYLLSGFVLTLSYGREEWRATTLKADPQEGVFHARSFYWNRAVRWATLPINYS